MDFNQVRYFLALADTLNFTHAAEQQGYFSNSLSHPASPAVPARSVVPGVARGSYSSWCIPVPASSLLLGACEFDATSWRSACATSSVGAPTFSVVCRNGRGRARSRNRRTAGGGTSSNERRDDLWGQQTFEHSFSGEKDGGEKSSGRDFKYGSRRCIEVLFDMSLHEVPLFYTDSVVSRKTGSPKATTLGCETASSRLQELRHDQIVLSIRSSSRYTCSKDSRVTRWL